MTESASYPYCIATIVTAKAISAMLETKGGGNYRDPHPWLVAKDVLAQAQSADLALPILFASKEPDGDAFFSHWSLIDDIEVVELHRGQWDSRCSFGPLRPVNPIFEPIDSIFLKTSQEQMDREALENIRVSRVSLDEFHIHPYAICETPMFISEWLAD